MFSNPYTLFYTVESTSVDFRRNSLLLCSKASGSIFDTSVVFSTVLRVHDIAKIT